MKLNHTGLRASSFLGVSFILIIVTSSTHGRAFHSQGDANIDVIGSKSLVSSSLASSSSSRYSNSPHIIRKRNAWWSKKSTADDVTRILGVQRDDEQALLNENRNVRLSIACYTGTCVPDFVVCGKRALSQSGFNHCKFDHRVCAGRCFRGLSYNTPAI